MPISPTIEKNLQDKIDFHPHKNQQEILNSKARDVVICAGRRFGKALDIKTPILTTKGFRNMELIEKGDYVFGANGKSTKVIRTTEIMFGHKCYEVIFSDNTSLIADAEHLWEVETKKYRKNKARNKNTEKEFDILGRRKALKTIKEIKTTKEISKDYILYRPDGKIEHNYSIPNTKPVLFKKKQLPIPPYILGCWLGDGSVFSSRITTADKQLINEFEKFGYELKKSNTKYQYGILTNEIYKDKRSKNKIGLYKKLREIGVFDRKHIPDIYKYTNVEQREELLKGLMDTDGTCGKNGSMEYCGVKKELCDDVNFILNSLGIKTRYYESDCYLYGRYLGKKYRIHFTTDRKVFKLKRKLKRQNSKCKKDITRRFIKEVKLIDSIPVKCIEVDNKEKLYLAGKELIPTHNSAVCAYEILRTLIWADIKGKPINVWIVAPTYDLAMKVFDYLAKWYLKINPEQTGISFRPPAYLKTTRGSKVECKSGENPEGLLGEELDLLVIDECSRIKEKIYQSYLYPTTVSRKARRFFISTPYGKNWFHRLWIKAKEKDGAFAFSSLEGVSVSQEEWDEAKKTLPEQIFKQEFEAKFLEDASSVFRNISEIIKDDCLKDVMPEHHYLVGWDPARHEDFSVITVIDKYNNNVVYFDRWQNIEYPFQKKRVKAIVKRYNNARIIVDSSVVGEPLKEDLERDGLFVDDFIFSGKSKKELIEKLAIFIEQKLIWIPSNRVLIDELEAFGYQLTNPKTGEPLKNIKYSAPTGLHDDCVCSLALAVWGLASGKVNLLTPIQREMQKVKRHKIQDSYI